VVGQAGSAGPRPHPPGLTRRERSERIVAAGPPASELARDAGGDRSVMSRFLAGKRTITLETVDRLAAVPKLRPIAPSLLDDLSALSGSPWHPSLPLRGGRLYFG
jgi:hypothetical protein